MANILNVGKGTVRDYAAQKEDIQLLQEALIKKGLITKEDL